MIAWALEALIASTLLMVAVLALRGPVRRTFGPECAYALWLLPLARLLLPPMPGAGYWSGLVAPLTEWLAQHGMVAGVVNPAALPAAVQAQRLAEVQIVMQDSTTSLAVVPPVVSDIGAPIAAILLALWLAGALLFIGWHVRRHARFIARVLRGGKLRDDAAVPGTIRVIESDAAAGPLAFGIWRKYVAFPRDFADRYDADEQVLALAHEMTHHARGDLIANWVALVVLGLHWFNPIAWRAFRAFRADQEMACDARVLAGRDERLRHAYGRAIVKSAHGGWVSAACHLHSINELKGRLRMLSKQKVSSAQHRAGLAVAGVIALAGLGATASGTQAAVKLREQVRSTTGIDLARLDQQAPAAPAAPAAPGVATTPVPPSAAPAAPEAPDTKTVVRKKVKIIVHDKDGKVQVIEPAGDEDINVALERAAPGRMVRVEMPEVLEKNCGGTGDTVVKQDKEKGHPRIIICTNRVAQIGADAAKRAEAGARAAEAMAMVSANGGRIQMVRVDSADIERKAYRSALDGLRNSRAAMLANPELTGAARDQAIKAVDQAIAEMESNIARVR
ncbi:M56 family metallopeptidase [Sphingomonas sp.]|uniref:M56 family metallopeptidase n=1 Tax=Sphingomonas sp. TaxID=28214 RepID=UPI001DFCA0BD|nr:M56 family metallopeptidase [Sphingomonas sp.]MBX9797790.1 M56 family metallopeptidase [Sphingomonas sp.]